MLDILTPSLHLLPARQHVPLYYCGHFVILPDVGFTSGLGLLPLGPCWHCAQNTRYYYVQSFCGDRIYGQDQVLT